MENIMKIVRNKPKDADCIQLHCSNIKKFNKMLKMNNEFTLKKGNWSTGCYYITRKGMSKIIKFNKLYT